VNTQSNGRQHESPVSSQSGPSAARQKALGIYLARTGQQVPAARSPASPVSICGDIDIAVSYRES